MKKQLLTLVIASAMTLLASAGAFAADIYKWTDAEGTVHYGDRPEGEQPQRLSIASRPTDPARIQAQTQARLEMKSKAAEQSAAAAAAGPSAEQLQAEASQRAEKCATYRERLQQFSNSRRLYREDEKGERVYLDDGETRAARERVENQVSEYCSS